MASDQTVGLPRPELSAAKRALIEARLRGQVRASGIVARAHRESAPLSFAQERLWFIDRLEPGSAAYNISLAGRLGGALDEAALERALREIVRRHEALRTTFREVDGSPVQVIAPSGDLTLRLDDLSGLAGAEREAEVSRRANEEAMRPFDLTAGPLVRAALLRLGREEHVMLLSMHHIVSDGWSLRVFFRELSALYAAYRAGRESPLPELAVQYADYAVWQREQLRGEKLERQLAYWRERLAGAPELLELPTDHPRPAVQTFRGARERIALPAELLERLRALGRSEGATLYMVGLAAFQVLLSKYSGSDDVVVGSSVAGRTRDEVAGLIGFFVNTLVLRTDLSGDPTFRDVLRQAREVTLGAYEHQELPFEKLVAELQPERSLSHSPLFQVSFELDDVEEPGSGAPESATDGVDPEFDVAKVDLSLSLVATRRGLLGDLNYSTDLFDRNTIERMLGHLERVLEQVAADADVRLSRLSLAGPEERAQVVAKWNQTERPFPREACIHQLFQAQAERTPDAAALVWGAEELTYRELDARSNRLAHHLAALGVGPESRVGLRLERGAENVVATLAVLKAGGCCVPVDISYPLERMELMLADSAVRILLSDGELAAGPDLHVIRLDQMAEVLAAEPDHAPPTNASAENLAYVFYTSGSTGRPKGVMMGHREVVQFAACLPETMPLGPGDRVAQASNASFDAAVFEIWGALFHGAALVGIDRDVLLSAPLLGQALRDQGITHLYQTAALFNQHVREQVDVYASLRQLVFGAEAVGTESVRRMLRAGKPARVLHEYGPTEATVWCTLEVVEEVAEDAPTVLIGRPIPNARSYVLDAAGEPLPVGIPGELCIGGAGVVRGYLGRPGQTAERFVPDPFAAEPGARMYRTGDRGRWKADGKLEFLGRVDDQVKMRGFRIEPGEVEAALVAYPGVRQARVMMREDQPGDKRLVAYVVGEVEIDGLRAHVRQSLPEYMVPSAFVFLEAIPLTPNGKVDRKALPVPEYASAGERYVAPRTPTEEVLAETWAQVLRLERVGAEENFFELGGHSLLATRVVSRIREVFGVELPLRALFEGPTIAELAARVEEIRRAGAPALPAVVPVDRDRPLPLSFAQERLWFIDRLEPGSAVYNIPGAWRLEGALDEAALERALGEIVRRHEALRTTFAEVNGSPVQVIAPFDGFDLAVEDLSALGEADREAAVGRRAGEEAARPFDLAAGPLFRAALLRLGEEDHVLLLSMHHVVSDGWSMGVFFREFSALYAAYGEGRESPLAELAVQYADYAVWQREQLAGEVLDRQLGYWKERLAGAPELLELPTDRPRPPVQTYRGASVQLDLSLELLERLQALGRSEGATPYMTLLGAFQVLLSKYSGSDDIVVGSPIAGRTRGEVEALIGFFVNTLVLRTDLSGDPSFREVLRRVREATLGAYEHQEVPFEKLVAELQPERSLSHAPLFQVSFALENAGGGGSGDALAGVTVDGMGAAMEIAKFDLSLTLVATPQGLRGGLNYNTDLFERATAERMLGHLARVLEQVAADADARLSGIALAGPEERARVVEAWNQTDRAYPRGVCIHELFESQVRERPDAVAVVWGDESLTYAELDARASQLANHLVRLGVVPDARVGVLLERSAELIVSILAVLKAGGCYVPLDPGYPPERLRLMLDDSSVRVLLSRSELSGVVEAEGLALIHLDQAAGALAAESSDAPRSGASPENLAYIVYTSGSTGKPKGVMVAHRHVVQLVVETDYVRFGPGDRIAQASNASFDALTFEGWGALMNGATLVGIPRDVLLSPPALREMLRAERITTLYQTTALLNQLSREQPDIFSPLREVLFGGQAVDADSVRRLLKAGGPERLLHMYGPTETTAWCSWEQVEHVADDALTVSVGRPTGNQRIYLLDSALHPVPVGVPGEAYVGGDGVVRGYLERPGLTAERFLPDPFAAEPGARMYRTGDRLRWKADGRLEFIGRVDEQVKVRGFRIEPGEIEAALTAHAGVLEVRVIVREDAGEQQLVAYVVGEADADALRAHLRESLPEYMVPGAFVALDRIPLTPNGKLDVKALPAPELALEDRYVAPRTPTEEVLAEIWAEVLRLERVGAEENFFELGGHSLLATRVVSRIREVFGVELPLRALFEGPTVAELAGRVEEIRRAGAPALPAVVPVERDRPLPLSFAQERLWFIDRLEPGSAVYNIPGAWRLEGALDESALERALGEIVRRHEALRTTFAEVDGSPVQVIAPFDGFDLPVEDLSGLSEADREAAVRRRAEEEALRPFDLATGPLFRAALLRLGAEDHVLLLSMHHVVSDGWSMGVFFREFSTLYAAYREGRESPLAELAVQYADYAVWQREQLEGESLDRQLSYWRERLAGAPELLELPTDRPRPPVQTYRGASVPVELSLDLLERLQALSRSEGATPYMTLLGAFQVLLSKYAGSEDIVVGSPIAGRTRGEVEALIGFFVNTLVLRTDLSGDPSFREVLRRVREATLGAYEHQEVPFEKLVAELQPERSLSHAPLFQVSLALNNAGGGGGDALAGVKVDGVGAAMEIAKFDLSLTLVASPHGLGGSLNYNTDLFERATAERMVGHLARVLERVAADADARLSGIALAGPEERAQVVEAWNQTDRAYPRGVCVHELFDAQVRERPDAVALVWGDESLTYAELDARANQLANHLVRLGVVPDARVGVLLERSAELIVSILAVLKAGGCYVPLDPGYPPERLRLMLDDSSVRVLISRSELSGVVEAGDLTVIRLDLSGDAFAAESSDAPRSGASPENLAYIVYTSGSTGKPKGVMVAHRHVVQLVCETDYVRFAPGDRIAQASNASFDALTFEAWGAFMNGATLVGIPRDVLLSPPALREMLREERITTLYQTTALLNQLSREQPDIFAPLRDVLFGGQAVDADSVRRLLKAGGPERLLHMYGPTETTAWCSWEQVEHVAEDALTVSVGRPTGNQRIYLLDSALNPVPVGVPGEAYVGGDGVVRGYLERPGLTAERFVPDPFASEPGARMYRTGDRLRWKGDGRLEFIGRVDEQVKVRGFRIEPGEIEAALTAHAGVLEVRVIVREDQPGEQRLVAYIVGEADADALREHLRESLPEYMVPGAFVALDRIPLTPNGKLDVKALPAPEYALEDRYVAPRTPAEEVLAEIWAEVLRLERVGATESFFELGGHSLLATRVVSRIREVFGVELPLRALFEGPTVAELASRVEEMRRAGLPALPAVVPVERTGAMPLSFAQERLWFIDRLEPGSAVHNIPVAWRLGGALDAAAVERAVGEIVRRHEALRTTFREVDGSPVQVIAPFDGFDVAVEDLSGLSSADREAAVARLAEEEAARPFDLSAGPLFRAALLRLGEEDHVLLLTMHHVVSDGWSMGVLSREFSALFQAYREGRESPLAELAVQYADYAVWQREQLSGESLDRQLAYWRERLAGAPELLELPTDRPRPPVQTYRGETVPVELSSDLLERLQALSRSEGATLYMTLLGAFQVLLGRYAGTYDVVVGSPIAGRTRGEVEGLIGFFVNTLVLRTDLSSDPSFREVLRRVREATLGAYEHQELPFEKLVAELQPERSLSHAPLFQVMFTLQNAGGGGGGEGALPGLSVDGVGAAMEIAKLDLSLGFVATPQGLRGGLNYSTDLFERGTIERMLGHLARVLEQIAADADVRLSQLELLGDTERALVLDEWNRTAAEVPADRCVHELFEAQAARTPDAVAVEFEGEILSYGALNERANRLAHHLAGLGVGPEARVGICLERGPEMIVSVLAVLKAGGVYVPLDPAYPAERLAFVMADAAVPVLVTQASLRSALLIGDGVVVVSVDGDAERIAAESAENPRRGVSPDQLAYVIYTSGSTGTPKGVMVPHRGVPNLAFAQARRFGIDGTSRVLQFASLSFDAAVAELFDALLAGATLVMASRENLLPGARLLETLRRGRVTVATLPPSVLAVLPPEDLPELRTVVSAGEAVDAATVQRWSEGRVFVNAYGPTETTVCATSARCEADGRAPSIGRALENVRVYVLDASGRPAPLGVPGELCVGGVGVVRGYLGRPGLTAERFIPDPFSTEGGARLYRTGDRVRWSARGELEFLGRVDAQVKVRGFRIEPGEIEAALRRHESVADCVVVSREDVPGETRLVAYVVGGADAEALRERLRRELPEHMVPAAFVSLDALPLTPNGKVDRKALPAPDFALAEERYVAPRTPAEEVLSGIWAEVLRLERVGVTESFFDLGGHSLLATRVVSRVRQVFGVEVSLRALFEGPTVAELAGRVEEMRRAELPVLPPVVPVARTAPLPLSFAQERLWFIDRLEPGSATYNIPAALRLTGALDEAALARAVGEVVRRHEALRTVFTEVDGSVVQVITPFGAFALPVEDLSALSQADREAAVRRRAGEEAMQPFDLSAGPLFRAVLLRLGAEDHVLLLSMHHIVSDGWSMGVLSREFSVLYAAYREGRESPLPELAVQYADYAVWQREQLAGEVLERQLSYWRERLADAPELLELPTDHPRPAVQTYRGGHEPIGLSGELVERLRALARSEGATLYMVVLGAFQVLLSKYSGSEDVVVGSAIAGRTRKEIEELIGFFVNTLVLRTDLGGDPGFREVLRRVREATLGAYEHQDLPFEKLVAELQPERSLSHSPLFQVSFTLENAEGGGDALQGLNVSGVGAELTSTKFDLSLGLMATPRGLWGGLTYRTDLFERGTITRMLGHLARVLEQVAADADVRLSQLELLDEAERALVLEEWNRTAAEYPADQCIHELFEAQAARTPGAVAVMFEGTELTFSELSARANRLAHHLRDLGVGPDARVGLCLERGVDAIVGLLAALKAGGAYVPMDPSYPVERLREMLADSRPVVLLTQASLRERVCPPGVPAVALDADADAWAERPETPPACLGLTPEHLAYVIYTSGSTGRPKGVMVRHGSVVNLASALQARIYAAHPAPLRVGVNAPLVFDGSVKQIVQLLAGHALCPVPDAVRRDPAALVAWLEHARVDAVDMTPSLLRLALAEGLGRGGSPRFVLVGGEAVDEELRERMSRVSTRFHNVYGPTECTVDATAREIAASGPASAIGGPLPNMATYVLDPRLLPVPIGVVGELYVGGTGLARGYLDRPGLTAERFVPDPFGGEPGARLYRTGDRVRWMADGALQYLGRLDVQVKIRGFRIELGEIEVRLAEHPDVRESVVLAREDQPGDRRLVAYVVGAVDTEALRAHVRRSLPDYMVPSAFVALDALPLTPNGKLDRKALPAPDLASAEERYVAPRTPVEEVLAGIWAEVLRLERVGVEESFFELGGHSLLATRVVSRIREVLRVEVPLRALFEGPTVAELAGRVEEIRRAGDSAGLPPLVPAAREAPLPLSFAQERLWFLHQMDPESAGYNMPWSGRLRGSVDAGALERALGALTERHESLRTTFRPVERGAVQVIQPPAPAHLPVVDLTALDPEDREDEARRLAQEEAERPFDLERGPLLRATLLRLSGEEQVLLLTMHHIVSDGWSMGVLFRELFALYESPGSPLPPLAVQYADFAVWQRGWLQGEVLERELDWWRERLGGAPPVLELPTDRPRPAVASSHGASLGLRLSADATRGLHALARREGATLYMVTHAALDLVLSRWSGQEDVVVGSPIAGRTQVGTEGLIGFFVNTLALRIDLSGDPTFAELLGRVRETALGAYAHQELPFERLVEEVAPDRGLSHAPLFQVMFQLQNADSGGGDSGGEAAAGTGLRREPFGGEIRTAHFDLELDLKEVGAELFGSLRFRTDLFDTATMQRFAAHYGVVLASVAASPQERLSRLAILPDGEARTLLTYGSGPVRDDAGDAPVHLLFAAQAARTPDAPALLSADESITYAELDARAERLARRLRGQAAPGAPIAVLLKRGPEAVVALLAIWKMGGVYLPLDPAHPVERLSFFLRDSGAKLVISNPALAGALLEREGDVFLLDPSAADDIVAEDLEPSGDGDSDDLAYLIYTSGSTGTPKAVMVEHAQLTHTLLASLDTLGFAGGDVVAALASTAFDISLLELMTPLLAGGAVRIVSHEVARDPETLVEAVGDVSVLHAVPALMRQVVEAARDGRMLPSLRLLLVGGDSVPPDLLEDMREVFPDARTVVLYGPTEAAIICATYPVPAEGAVVGHPLGRPLPNVQLAVRGPRGELAPVGVPGELWISGGGVTRGYLGRPELNAEKFVGEGTERAYRTGDRARWRTDGVLEFLGRADEQVKVRGFRIEPGEVEAVLREQPGVREAVVLAREDVPGDRRLVAYVVPGADADGVEVETDDGKEQVSEWETLFDDTYAQDESEDPTLALKGWNSSYTGEPIPREEMRAWADQTAERILALRPERVLEIGAGTGLVLFRVAPHTQAYHGTDFSAVALNHIRRHSAGLPQVTLSKGEADGMAEFAGAGFDTVILNSVAQYFPDVEYLLRMLEGAAAALRPGGRIFVGDVRSLPLAGAFHASVELSRAPDDLPAERLQARVRRGVAEEQELLVDPTLFEALRARMPRLGRVEVQVKRGEYDNEVSRFRYDVVLHLDAAAPAASPVVREWSGEDAAALRVLAAETGSALLVRGVPDARVREHVRAQEVIASAKGAVAAGDVRTRAGAGAGDGVQPAALFALGDALARRIEVRPGAAGTLDVLFHPAAEVARFPVAVDAERPWQSYANDPQWGRRMRTLVPALREAARARLPEYMVPSAFVVLEAFPVTSNGKVDRGALPAPDTLGARGTYVAPRTPAEEQMAGIWSEVLGVERVGVDDNFFELGGHSLLATQLVSRVREAFRVELPLRAVFEAPALAELAGRVETLVAEAPADAVPPLVPAPRDGSPLPLSFAQQRMWFIDQLEPGSTAYHMPSAQRLRGPLDTAAMERALGEVVRRHEALRTTFGETGGVPFQVVHPAGPARLEVTDLSGLAPAEREAEAGRIAGEEAQRPFDLRAGPLFRTRLLRLAEDDHVLVMAMHHVVSDGWSMGVLSREITTLYEAFARGEPSPLPELPVQYADFAVWQRAWLSGETLERQIGWWRDRLEGAPPVLELPTDRPRQATPGPRTGRVFGVLPPGMVEGMRALARREGATLYMVLLAALDLLLARWSGQEDVVVGTPIANRTRRETEGLIGFFVNTLALRTDLSGNPSFQALLRRVRDVTLGAYQHQDVPFERLVDELKVERSLSHTPLFQVVFSVIEGAAGGSQRPVDRSLAAEPYGSGGGAAKFDLDVTVTEQEGGLGVAFTYRDELWDAPTMQRVATAYALLLQAAAADPERPALSLPLVSDAERESLLAGSSGPRLDTPAGQRVHDLFAAQAARTPHAPALVHAGQVLDYAGLEHAANRLANHLRRLGVRPETRVGICLERGPELVIAMLAILKAGGAYVPLDPQYPAERLGYMREDAGITLVITHSALADRLPEDVAGLLLDQERDIIAMESPGAPESGVRPENLSHVIFTSGSTGRPKGVMIRHASVVVLLHWLRENITDAERSSVLFSTSINFDVSVAEVFGTLCWGGKLVIAENALELATIGEDVVHVSMVPSAAAELLKSGGIPASVRTLNLGGEALPNALAQGLYGLETVEKVGNLYGPTEDTTYSTYYVVPRGADQVLVGKPVANTHAYVLDAHLQPVPIGLVGELYLAGDGLSRGYANRPAMTAERFVPCPFGPLGARMYRVMDRVRRRPDGEIEYLGRTDFQVKVRGYRIELGEIEARLREHAGVREVVVTVREDLPGDRRLVAYVVGEAEAEALRAHVRLSLPEYMVPSAFVPLEALPLTPNGKLDRKALPAPELASAEDAYVAPSRPLEAQLAEIWAEVLGCARVGVKENFFDLGGHSLLLMQVQARIRETMDRKIPIVDLFRLPTVAALAEHMGGEAEGAGGSQPAPEGGRRRGRDRAAVRRALAGKSGGTTHNGDDT